MQNTIITIIVVNYNTAKLLESCLASIYKNTIANTVEIIVVDNASSDASCSVIEQNYPQILLVKNNTNRGFAAACNQAIRLAKADYLMLLNTDTIFLNDVVSILHSFIQDNAKVGICGPQLLNQDLTVQKSIAEYPTIISVIRDYCASFIPRSFLVFSDKYSIGKHNYSKRQRIIGAALTGACLMIRRSLFEEIGLFDEKYFFYYEETDWSLSVSNKGWEIWSIPEARVIHYHMATVKLNIDNALGTKIKVLNIKALIYFFRKNYSVFHAASLKLILIIAHCLNISRQFFLFFIAQLQGQRLSAYKYNLSKELLRAVLTENVICEVKAKCQSNLK